MTLTIRPLSAQSGAEISGVDLKAPLDDAIFSEIRNVLHERGAIFFRGQHLTPAEQAAFARRFGQLDVNDYATGMTGVDGEQQVRLVAREPQDGRNIGGFWHMDQSFHPHPNYVTMLAAVELPPFGGDTMFAHLGAACDALSDGMRTMLEGLSTVHVKSRLYGSDGQPSPDVTEEFYRDIREKWAGLEATHPLIAIHPDTGRRLLYYSPKYSERIDGWTRAESLPLMNYLAEVATRPEHVCRYSWTDGDLALWDNRSVLHYALDDYPGHRRVMHRIVIGGEWLRPVAQAA
jgi:taurine dioxygenase